MMIDEEVVIEAIRKGGDFLEGCYVQLFLVRFNYGKETEPTEKCLIRC